MSGLLVGVDVGTSSCKAGVYDTDGDEIAVAYEPMPWEEVPTGAQIAPDELAAVAHRAVAAVLADTPDGPIAALGVTSMAETGVLVDGDGRPLAPAIAWHDQRGQEDAAALAAELGDDAFTRRTGLALRPLCSASKVRWLDRDRGALDTARRWHNVAEWIVASLGGDPRPELSLSSRTGWLDLAERSWWTAALAACGASEELLGSSPVGAGTPMGTAADGPDRLRGATLTVAGHDHLAAAVGVGAIRDGDVFDSSGTAEAFIAPVAPPVDEEQIVASVAADVTVGWHAVPDRYALLGAQRAGLALQRFVDLLGLDGDRREAVDRAAAELSATGMWVDGLEDDEATLSGIGWSPSPAAVWRAAVDAVTVRSAELLGTVETVTGGTERLLVGGGWVRFATVRAAKRARLGEFSWPRVEEPGCRGAALVAGVAAEVFDGFGALPEPPVRQDER